MLSKRVRVEVTLEALLEWLAPRGGNAFN